MHQKSNKFPVKAIMIDGFTFYHIIDKNIKLV
nr:MAG TPA: hypothetical protein [Bacteriophage sp.]